MKRKFLKNVVGGNKRVKRGKRRCREKQVEETRHAGSSSSNPRNPQCHQARLDGRAKANPLAADVPYTN